MLTIKDAQIHFRTYTRSVLTDEARNDLRDGIWATFCGEPCLFGNKFSLAFERASSGRVVARQCDYAKPNKSVIVRDKQMHADLSGDDNDGQPQ